MGGVVGGMFFWFVVVPGVLYLFLTKRIQELTSPGSWLLAAGIGILIMFPTGLIWIFAEPQEFLGFLQEGRIDAVGLVHLGIGVYLTWLFGIAFHYMKQASQRIGKLWISLDKSLTEGQKLSVKYDLVRKLMEMLYAADVLPYIKIRSGNKSISGYCLKYTWEQPSYLLMAEDNENSERVLKVFIGTVDDMEVVKDRCIFKKPGAMEEFFKMVRPDLPELMRK